MVSKTLVLLALFVLVVVSETATASRTHPNEMKSKNETVKPNQQGYGGNGPIDYGIGYGTGGNGPKGYGVGGGRAVYCSRCCIRVRNGDCAKCCGHAEEAVQAQHGH